MHVLTIAYVSLLLCSWATLLLVPCVVCACLFFLALVGCRAPFSVAFRQTQAHMSTEAC